MRFAATVIRCAIAAIVALATVPGVISSQSDERTRVIVRLVEGRSMSELRPLIERMGGIAGPTLDIINAQVAELSPAAVAALSRHPFVAHISPDRAVVGTMERTSATIGALSVRQNLGYDGAGVGVVIIDSGITPWHDDLASGDGGQRVTRFEDMLRNRPHPYDDYGHGTHVAGIIAGDGFDSGGARAGVAPGVRPIVLKVLDEKGNGRISDVVAALDYVVKKKEALNIRVVNLSVATGVYESYMTDSLTLAAKRVVDAGVIVVAAAGNLGQTGTGLDAYGGITSPGNAPWVLTVGASNHMGTSGRSDDQMAVFSSRGPTAVDRVAKPDLVAPGVGIESLSNQDSTFYRTLSPYLMSGTVPTGYLPYLSLTGTSMAAPVVTGTIALMLQANPALTPNAVKAILQYTAQTYPGYDPLTQGAGFLNAAGAVELARFLANPATTPSSDASWSRHIIWGNQLVSGAVISADAQAWKLGVTWGATSSTLGGDGLRNIVWGMRCGGGDCGEQWTLDAAVAQSVVWGTSIDESVVWGTWEPDGSVVWGTIGVR